MWAKWRRQVGALTLILGLMAGLAGCGQSPASPGKPDQQPAAMRHGMVKMQAVLDAHPQRAKLAALEQTVAAADPASGPSQAAMDAVKQEYDAAMQARHNTDLAAIETKESQLKASLNQERSAYIESLDAEYQPQLFNLGLKLQAVQYAPAEKQKLEAERARLEAERLQKLKNKDAELGAKFEAAMKAFVDEQKNLAAAYADQWMQDRVARMRQDAAASPELEKQRRELDELSAKVLQDIKAAVKTVADSEKLDMVWVHPAVRYQAKDITEQVKKELMK